MPEPRYELEYWPIPFRGCFVSYLFAYADVALREKSDFEKGRDFLAQAPAEQDVPVMGLPVLRDLENNVSVSQMPAIVLYASEELGLMPSNRQDLAMGMKVLMDCNDLLMEICRYNGTSMWNHEDWQQFRSQRLVRWLQIFETSLTRDYFGKQPVSFADIAVYALFGNMVRCLPDLKPDLAQHAPGVEAFCETLGAHPALERYVADQESKYEKLYCGGQIEQSIRRMLEIDAN